MYYLIVTFFTGGVVWIIVSAMDYYPVYRLAKSNFERATWNNQSSRVRFLSIACANFHDRQHLSQYFATLPISYPVRTKALFHEETVAGACTRYSIFNLVLKYTCTSTSTSPGLVWTREKISSPPGFAPRPSILQRVAITHSWVHFYGAENITATNTK